ncbi:MAG: aminopeptidase P N-terminal domain-containing protein, partial [Clostridia bacterium]
MDKTFHIENRQSLYKRLPAGSLAVLFSGNAPRKTADEYYPFFADRSFVYFTGVEKQGLILLAQIDESGVKETMFILPPDFHAERWTGSRIKANEVLDKSGIGKCRYVEDFARALKLLAESGNYENLYLDLDKLTPDEPDSEAYRLARLAGRQFPFMRIRNLHPHIKVLRTIKKPCEIHAMRKAESITREGITAMMKASRAGMYEYQYKAVWDYTLAQHGVLSPMFPSIISAGKNNFCIHYYDYRGQALDGDMVLNDVGACWDNVGTDVSRGWPVNGRFSEKQRLLYQCAYNTSNYMFSIIRPGMAMGDVDATIRKYNFEQLRSIGLCDKFEDVGKYIWHGGAHHVGYDTHDVVHAPLDMPIAPNMVFCVDVGIYCEEWGIGFRLEDNCLVTENGCENLSRETPRSIEEIEDM